MIYILTFILSFVSANELVAAETAADVVADEKNAAEVVPSYTQIDNTVEKKIDFAWGSVYYTSLTQDDDHDHADKLQTHMNVRYVCKNGGKKSTTQRFEFCGYAKSDVDTQQRTLLIAELKKYPENKGKNEEQLIALYESSHNDRIADPAKNISEIKTGNTVSVEITVRQKTARFGICEDKISKLILPVDCK